MKKLVLISLFSIIFIIGLNFQTKTCADGACGRETPNAIDSLLKNWSTECGKVAEGKTGEEASRICLGAGKYSQLAPKLKQLANNGPFTLGPRDLSVGTSQNGTIVNPAFRTFLTSALLDKDTLTIKVEKKGGKGGANIRICKIDEKKKYTHLKTLAFAEGDATSIQSAVVTGVKAHLVQVFIDGTGGVSKAFDYTLTTSAN
ncbi:MAG: hypothetical protein AAB336_12570 [Acidobacteriota bacterium]